MKEAAICPSGSLVRLIRKLRDALGEEICAALDDPAVVEVMLNPDGQLFIERVGQRVSSVGNMSRSAAEVVIGSVAHVLNSQVDLRRPIVSGEIPIGGHRFEGLLPPVVSAPTFSIRRKASQLISLNDYLSNDIITNQQAAALRHAIKLCLNIVIAGGTGSGKTTLANAIIEETAQTNPNDRFIILEDTAEIQCFARNVVALHTTETIDMTRLLKSTMRLRPDRIIVGEVRDGAALTLLKAWNTGHPGGIATVHANSAPKALQRLEQLVAEVSQQPMQAVICQAVNVVVFIKRTANGRRVTDVLRVGEFTAGSYQLEPYSGVGQ